MPFNIEVGFCLWHYMLTSCLEFIDILASLLGNEHFTLSFAKHINDNDHLCNKKEGSEFGNDDQQNSVFAHLHRSLTIILHADYRIEVLACLNQRVS